MVTNYLNTDTWLQFFYMVTNCYRASHMVTNSHDTSHVVTNYYATVGRLKYGCNISQMVKTITRLGT